MKRRTKVLLVIVAGLLVAAGIFGATAAFADNSSSSNSTTPEANLMQKIADNYQALTGQSLNTTALQQAFSQAQAQVQQDAVKSFLDKLVQKGVITQDQETQYLNWLSSKPDIPSLNGNGGFFGRLFGARGFGHVFGFFRHPNSNQDQSQTQPQGQSSNFRLPAYQPGF